MNTLRRALLLVFFASCSSATVDQLPADPGGGGKGDEQRAAGRATVIVHYPAGWGHRISLRGSGGGLDWGRGRDATWTTDDAWTLAVELDGVVELKPLFDDAVWAKGPNFRLAPGQTLELWPAFFHDRGRLETRRGWDAAELERNRDVVIYLPPSYDENGRAAYPVVYMHDGQNLWNDRDAFGGVSWNVAGAMDRGFVDGSMGEALVVGVGNTADRIWEYTPTDGGYGGGGAAPYVAFLADELKPVIDRDYRTRPEREHTAIVGSSLGGLVSVWAGIHRDDSFGLVGALSPSTWWDDRMILAELRGAGALPVRVYVDSGDAGNSQDDVVNTTQLAAEYRARGADLRHVVQRGASHNELWWRQRLPGALAFLVGPGR